MECKETTTRNTHHGHAIKRFRHTLGMKQETLASIMNLSQAQVSTYEQKKIINEDMIQKFAKAIGVAPELIKELEEDPVTVIIENNTVENGNIVAGDFIENNNPDPIDRIIELTNEKIALFERMLEMEKERNALLEKLLRERK